MGANRVFRSIKRIIYSWLGSLLSLIRSSLNNLRHASISAGAWSAVWLFAFFGSTVVVELSDGSSEAVSTTALSITAAVLSGHLAKLISYYIGCDTDFRHLSIKDHRSKEDKPDIFRLTTSLCFLSLAAVLLFSQITEALSAKNVVDSEFILYSASFWCVILCIFFAQLVFSWPDSIPADVND